MTAWRSRKRIGVGLLFTVLLLLAVAALRLAWAEAPLIDDWYAALSVPDRARLEALLHPTAKIQLTDLGIEQSKAEFMASLDEWEAAVAGATIRHRIEATDGDVTTVLACYDFRSNDVLMRETFRIDNGLIVENRQTAIAEDCGAF